MTDMPEREQHTFKEKKQIVVECVNYLNAAFCETGLGDKGSALLKAQDHVVCLERDLIEWGWMQEEELQYGRDWRLNDD